MDSLQSKWIHNQTINEEIRAIRFGLGFDIYVPSDSHVIIRLGKRVRAGITIRGYLP